MGWDRRGGQQRVGGVHFKTREREGEWWGRRINHRTGIGVFWKRRRRRGYFGEEDEEVGGLDGMDGLSVGRGGVLSPLMRGTSSRAQAHFLFLKVNRQPAGVRGVMGKEETVMLISAAHTSPPSNNKTKQEGKRG